MLTFKELAEHLALAEARVEERMEVALNFEMGLVAETAKSYIGQERPEWPPLAERTIRAKERLGYVGRVSATDPLLRTGQLRDSIFGAAEGFVGVVASTSTVARDQELGTSAIPPRPFLALAMAEEAPEVAEALNYVAYELLIPRP